MQALYRAKAPLRLGLAGGGTDVSPFCDQFGGLVLNATIDLYAHAILEPRNDGQIIFAAQDLNKQVKSKACINFADKGPLRLHKAIYNFIVNKYKLRKPLSFKLTTFADAPPGSGLGTSSTMVVCIIQIFSEWLGLALGEYEVANMAFEIERNKLKLLGGKQDQFAAAFGGFNFIEFGPGDRVLVNPLRIKDWVLNELEASTVLFYTGQSRESTRIIEQQIANTKASLPNTISAMLALKQDAQAMKGAILIGDLKAYANILARSWQAKKRLAGTVTNTTLDEIYKRALAAGALAGKISGAGGGGFFMFYVPPRSRMAVIRELSKHHGEVVNFHFTNVGAQSWILTSS